jgi:hypothetical protein
MCVVRVCVWVGDALQPTALLPRARSTDDTHTRQHTHGGGGGGTLLLHASSRSFLLLLRFAKGQRGNRGDTHAQKRNDQRKR